MNEHILISQVQKSLEKKKKKITSYDSRCYRHSLAVSQHIILVRIPLDCNSINSKSTNGGHPALQMENATDKYNHLEEQLEKPFSSRTFKRFTMQIDKTEKVCCNEIKLQLEKLKKKLYFQVQFFTHSIVYLQVDFIWQAQFFYLQKLQVYVIRSFHLNSCENKFKQIVCVCVGASCQQNDENK